LSKSSCYSAPGPGRADRHRCRLVARTPVTLVGSGNGPSQEWFPGVRLHCRWRNELDSPIRKLEAALMANAALRVQAERLIA
jgi:hypothetical protein